jgi:hypothetical protein
MFSFVCEIWNEYKYKQYYEKQIMLRGGHIWEREGKKGSKEGEYGWCSFYTRMNIEFINLSKSP